MAPQIRLKPDTLAPSERGGLRATTFGDSGVAEARIAVIDDDVSHIELLEEVPADEGYEVVGHADLRDANAFLKDQRPALVVLDLLQGRRLLGLEVIRQLKPPREMRNLSVIDVSADASSLRENAAELRLYAVFAVDKPYSLEELLSLSRDAIHGNSGARPGLA